MKLSVKIALGFIPMAVLWTISLYWWTGRATEKILFKEIDSKVDILIRNLVQTDDFVSGIMKGQETPLLTILQEKILGQENVLYAFVMDSKNRIIAHTDVGQADQVFDPKQFRQFEREGDHWERRTGPLGENLEIIMPVRRRGAQEEEEEFLFTGQEKKILIGKVCVGYSLRPVLAMAQRVSEIIFLIVLVSSMALILLAALFLKHSVVTPVGLLLKGARRLGEGRLGEVVPILSDDEIGQLTQSFNQMSLRLAQTSVSRDSLNAVINSMNDALIVTDDEGRIKMINDTALKITGYAPRELTGAPAAIIFAQNAGHEEGLQSLQNELFEKTASHLDLNFLTKDGNLIAALVSVSSLQDPAGHGFIIVAKDMTELRRMAHIRETVSLAAKLMVNADHLKKIYEELPRFLCERFGVAMSVIEIYRPQEKNLMIVGSYGAGALSPGTVLVVDEKNCALSTITDRAVFEKEALLRLKKVCPLIRDQGAKTFICSPMRAGMAMVGALALADPSGPAPKPFEAAALRQIGDLLAQTILRAQSQEALKRRAKAEDLVIEISADFLSVPAAMIDQGIERSIRKIGEFAQADRAYVFLISSDGLKTGNAYEWCAPGIPSGKSQLQNIPVNRDAWPLKNLINGEAVQVSKIEDIPDQTQAKEISQTQKMKSWAVVPMISEGQLIGLLGLSTLTVEKVWPEEDLLMLKLAAETMVSAFRRRDAQRELTRLASFPEENPNPVVELDEDWKLTYVNPAARAQLVGLIEEGINYQLLKNLRQAVDEMRAGKQFSRSQESRLGGFIFSQNIVLAAESSLVRVYFTDITEKRRLEEMALQSEKMAAMGQLAAGVAHEVNNPLGGALGITDILLDEIPKDAGIRKDLEVIKRSLVRCKDIVANLLGFSRRHEFTLKPEILQELIEDTLGLCKDQLSLCGVNVARNFGSKRFGIKASTTHLQQVFLNLILNAKDAMKGGGLLTITIEEGSPGWVRVIFQDSGEGIPPEVMKRIFEPFFTTKEKGRGTGLGLALSFDMVSRHGGRLEALSDGQGRGSQFIVNLPLMGVS